VDSKDRPSQILQFGVFEVDLAQGELRKYGRKIKLQDRPFQLLTALLEHPGQVVTREELARKLWIDTLVDFDNGLNIAAKKVRDALDDNAATPRYVETLPRRGYRFIAPVQARPLVVSEPAAAEKPTPPIPPPAAPPPAPTSFARRRHIYVRGIGLIIVLFLAVRIYWLVTSVRPARVFDVVQLTQSGRAEFNDGVATDGSRVYFTQREGGRWSLAQVSVQGGNPQMQPAQIPNPNILDISPDRSSLLVSSGTGVDPDRSLWIVPTVGGSPRRLGDVMGRAGAWSRDGSRIVFVRGAALFLVNTDGTGSHKLLDTPGSVNFIRWSPPFDREVLRFSLSNPGKPAGLWESAIDGSHLHRLLPDWNPGSAATDGDDSGIWAAAGKYFLFRSVRGRDFSIWAMRENRTFPRSREGPPVQLHSASMTLGSLAPNPDGKKIFFAGAQERGELVRYDATHQQFLPFLTDVAGRWAAFSRDEQWVTYVTSPDDSLWRSRPDGSERLLLTPPGFTAREPAWSPDGTRIIFAGPAAGENRKLQAISSSGGAPEDVTSDLYAGGDACWSPDGESLLFAGKDGLYVMNWKTRKSALVPGSEALARPAWSADARYIAATNREGTKIMLLDRNSNQWTALAEGQGLGLPFWSHDSKFVYYQDVLDGAEQPVFRISIAGRRKEQIASAQQIPQSNAVGYLFVGLGPHDAPIATVIHTNSDIYAMDVELP
jgi:Tol biopolymer transport system component/DNA-binding winged helix-turn-helix (wHTH) protein